MRALPGTPVGGLFPPRLPPAIGEGQPHMAVKGRIAPQIGNQGKILFWGFLPYSHSRPISGPNWFPISGRRPEVYLYQVVWIAILGPRECLGLRLSLENPIWQLQKRGLLTRFMSKML